MKQFSSCQILCWQGALLAFALIPQLFFSGCGEPDKKLDDKIRRLRESSQEEIQSYCIGHEGTWMALAKVCDDAGLKGYVNDSMRRETGFRDALQKDSQVEQAFRRFDICCGLTRSRYPRVALTILFSRKHFLYGWIPTWAPTEFWDVYYIVNEDDPSAKQLREKVKTETRISPKQRNGYCWAFGDHWVGERVK
jgi:hypothetical protein